MKRGKPCRTLQLERLAIASTLIITAFIPGKVQSHASPILSAEYRMPPAAWIPTRSFEMEKYSHGSVCVLVDLALAWSSSRFAEPRPWINFSAGYLVLRLNTTGTVYVCLHKILVVERRRQGGGVPEGTGLVRTAEHLKPTVVHIISAVSRTVLPWKW